jgi:hypothetical protein
MDLYDIFISLQTILHTLLGQDIKDGLDKPLLFCSFIQCSSIGAGDFLPRDRGSDFCKIDQVGNNNSKEVYLKGVAMGKCLGNGGVIGRLLLMHSKVTYSPWYSIMVFCRMPGSVLILSPSCLDLP